MNITKEEFAHNIDLTPLYNKIRTMLNSPELGFETKIEGDYISIKSTDITSKTGVFALAIANCNAQTFNSRIRIHATDNETNAYYTYWGTIDLRYTSHSGGFNGMEILRFDYNYNNDNEWTFKEARNNE